VDTTVIRLKERVGFAHAAYAGLLEVRTECVAVVQHDLAFVRGVDLGALCDALTTHHGVSWAVALLLSRYRFCVNQSYAFAFTWIIHQLDPHNFIQVYICFLQVAAA
jgi:hypothetical protein